MRIICSTRFVVATSTPIGKVKRTLIPKPIITPHQGSWKMCGQTSINTSAMHVLPNSIAQNHHAGMSLYCRISFCVHIWLGLSSCTFQYRFVTSYDVKLLCFRYFSMLFKVSVSNNTFSLVVIHQFLSFEDHTHTRT